MRYNINTQKLYSRRSHKVNLYKVAVLHVIILIHTAYWHIIMYPKAILCQVTFQFLKKKVTRFVYYIVTRTWKRCTFVHVATVLKSE